MAKIESYVLANAPLSGSDKLIGTDTAHDNATKNFSINELITFITNSDTYVPYSGATGTVDLNNNNLINVANVNGSFFAATTYVSTNNLYVNGSIYLNANPGTAGLVLTSQGSGLPSIWSSAATGPQGVAGPVGPQGPIGPVGPAGLTWRGAWVSGTSYIINDAVGYNGASWFCISPTSGTTTPNLATANWALLAAQGAQGPIGPTGPQGPTGATGPAGASGTNTLQQVLTAGSSLANGRNFQGTSAGTGNLGFNVNGFGTNVATNNSGSNVNAFGTDAADNNTANNLNAFGNLAAANNTGTHVNAFGDHSALSNTGVDVNAFGNNSCVQNIGDNVNGFGELAANGNTGDNVNAIGSNSAANNTGTHVNAFGSESGLNNTGTHVNAFGYQAGYSNSFSNVNLFGNGATANGNNQVVFRNGINWNARISYNNVTGNRKYELPDESGTVALENYLVYSALISASGGTPTATVLKNTFGITFNLSNPSNGIIRITAATGSPFTNNKTWITSGGYNNGGQPYIVTSQRANLSPTTMVDFYFFLYDGTISATPNVTNFSIEIRVYP